MAKQCKRCGAEFSVDDGRRKYCDNCMGRRSAFQQQLARRRRRPDGTSRCQCQRCGKEFQAGRADAKWCPECQIPERRRRDLRKYEDSRKHPCPECGKLVHRRSVRCRKCAAIIRNQQWQGENNPSWKGGKTRTKQGYVFVRTYGDKRRYRGEHNVVWEQVHGHPLPNEWVVHHLNGRKDDNRPENLAGMPRNEHHSHPRAALRPYEQRIRELEELVRRLGGDPSSVGRMYEHPHAHGHG